LKDKIVVQNMLASDQHLVTPTHLFESFLRTKKKLAIFLSVQERAFRLEYAKQEWEWSLQLIKHQLVAIRSLQSSGWPVQQLQLALNCGIMEIQQLPRLAPRLL
jgi:hypothetical protein